MKNKQKNKLYIQQQTTRRLKYENQMLREVLKVYQAHLEKVILKANHG